MSEFIPSVTITLAEYQRLLACETDLARYRLPPPATPPIPAPPPIPEPTTALSDLEDLAPVIEEKLIRGLTANQENLSTDDFVQLSTWLLKLAKLTCPSPFTPTQLLDHAAGRGVTMRPAVVLFVLQAAHRDGLVDFERAGEQLHFTLRKP